VARVVLDADLLIALLDPADAQHSRAVPLLQKHLAAGDELLVCASAYAEILVRPLQEGTDGAIDEFVAAAGVQVVPVDRSLARAAAQLRAEHTSLRLPNAMCLACALQTDAALLAFDQRLTKISSRLRSRTPWRHERPIAMSGRWM
jgi:predicted nucleic acid-binding protein